MAKEFLKHIVEDIKNYHKNILLVENNDGFLFREDIIKWFEQNEIIIVSGTSLQQRIQFELRKENQILLLVSKDNSNYLEDIKNVAFAVEFFLEKYFNGYHIPSIIELDIESLEKLYANKKLTKLSKQQTINEIMILNEEKEIINKNSFNRDELQSKLSLELENNNINWNNVAQLIANAIIKTIPTGEYDKITEFVNTANNHFQQHIEETFQQTKNASAIKKPKIVSKIADYINFNFKNDKIALIVVDGLAYWQYEVLKKKLSNIKNEEVIYSWIPSITQLSRQAIFRGDNPLNEYKQGPINEEKLWKNYWIEKGLNDFQIKYQHENTVLEALEPVTKLALVFKDLDEKMHSSTDYKDLLKLTENWIERSQITKVIEELLQKGFKIFLTTDHGNIQARGWRGLKGREKLGTNKSGSRSERHIEYTEKWLSDDFIQNNPELADAIVMEEQAIYFKNDLSFSRKETLVTHGGAHILEVLIPFIEISNDK